jgi:thiamine biosynthesis protein ThiI
MSPKQQEPQFDTVIIRFGGEIGIKAAWTRKFYERRLASNIKATLKQHATPYETLNRKFGRFYLKTLEAEDASRKLTKVFGVSSVSPALEISSELSDITQDSVRIAGSILKEGSSFAVSCRRVGQHGYTSQDVCREVGRQILLTYAGRRLRVDLKHPETTINVEVRENKAYIYTGVIKGPGGMPLGSQPKVVCLLNGDINSLAACWMVMKRGCPVLLLHFDKSPFENENTTQVFEIAKTLFEWAAGFPRNVYVVSHGSNMKKIDDDCSKELRRILSKRMMYRIAEQLGEKQNAEGIVTGESLNKPAHEALHILRLQDAAVARLPVHRPLIGLDTSEIEELAEKISANEKSLVQKMKKRKTIPKLRVLKGVTLKEVKEAEAKLPVERMVEASLKSLRIITL